MPSEKIYSPAGVDVRVAWGDQAFGTVQIASLVSDERPVERIISIVNEWLELAGDKTINVEELTAKMRAARVQQGELPMDPHFDGYHATLADWSSVNRLIHVLKRARDQAFGRPE